MGRGCARCLVGVHLHFLREHRGAGRLDSQWGAARACTLGVVQGSVLSPLLATRFLVGLQDVVACAYGGVRWLDVGASMQRTHSLWCVGDGALLAESARALQRILDAARRCAHQCRVELRLGVHKSAVLGRARIRGDGGRQFGEVPLPRFALSLYGCSFVV